MSSKIDREQGSRTLAALGVVVLLACGYLMWQATPESSSRASLVLKKRPMQLFDRVYMLGSLSPSVAYVIDTDDELILVDSGLESDCTALLQQIKYLQLDPARIKKVLLTHAHGDHVLGARYLSKLTGAQIYGGRGDVDVLRAGGPREALFSTYDMPDVRTHSTEIDVPLSGGETIESGGLAVEVIATPGHTPGSLCYLLEYDGQRVLFTGDTISTITGDLGTFGTYLPPRFRSNASDYLASLKTLRDMPPPTVLLPGHPRIGAVPGTVPQSMPPGGMMAEEEGIAAEITSEQWLTMLDTGIAEMETLIERYKTDGRDFLDQQAIEILPNLWYLGRFADRAIYAFRHKGRFLLFDPPSGPGLFEFVESRLKQLQTTITTIDAVALTSCDPESSGGLTLLLKAGVKTVIAAEAGRDLLRQQHPGNWKLIAAESLQQQANWAIRLVPVAGLGMAPAAYLLELEGKRILISGRIPGKLDSRGLMQEFLRDIRNNDGNASALLDAYDLLEPLRPNIWLPSSPVHGQNANIYGDQWREILERNRDAIRSGSG